MSRDEAKYQARLLRKKQRCQAFRDQGLCSCGRKCVEGYKTCDLCRLRSLKPSNSKTSNDTSTKIRLANKAKGLCGCGRELVDGFKCCQICRARALTSITRIQNERRTKGLCVKCGGTPECGYKTCKECRNTTKPLSEDQQKRHRERNKELRESRIAQGLCARCGIVEAEDNRILCNKCSERINNRRRANRDKGLCQCGKECINNSIYCSICFTHSVNVKKMFKERLAVGLCKCGRIPDEGFTVCRVCLDSQIAEYHNRCKQRLCTKCGDVITDTNLTTCQKCRTKGRMRNAKLRKEVFEHYGCTCSCKGCNISHIDCLELHHINNDGAEHRKQIRGHDMLNWIKANNYPENIFAVLCANCHRTITKRGYCSLHHSQE